MSDSEHQSAAAPEQPDEVSTPTEAVVKAAINDNTDDVDVPQLETADNDDDNDGAHEDETDKGNEEDVNTPIRQKQDHLAPPYDGSELESIDADSVDLTPRRTGSPIDSLASAQGISPSIQVCQDGVAKKIRLFSSMTNL